MNKVTPSKRSRDDGIMPSQQGIAVTPVSDNHGKVDDLNSFRGTYGVTMRPSGKWQAQLYYLGKSRYIGVFNDKEEAFSIYRFIRKRLQSHGHRHSQESADKQFQSAKQAALEYFKSKKSCDSTGPSPITTQASNMEHEGKHIVYPSPVRSSVGDVHLARPSSGESVRFLFFKGIEKRRTADGCIFLPPDHPVLDQLVEDLIRIGDGNVKKVFSLTHVEDAKIQRGEAAVQIICDRAKFALETFHRTKVRDLVAISSSSEISIVVSVEEEKDEKRTYILSSLNR
jgi:hypothetical protein